MGGLGVIIESNLNRVRLSCCWVGVGLVLGWVVTIIENCPENVNCRTVNTNFTDLMYFIDFLK